MSKPSFGAQDSASLRSRGQLSLVRGKPAEDGTPSLRLLAVVPTMLETLDTLTAAGQHNTMGKIVALLREQSALAYRAVGFRSRRVLDDRLKGLGCDLDPVRPDIETFRRCAELVIGLLTAIFGRHREVELRSTSPQSLGALGSVGRRRGPRRLNPARELSLELPWVPVSR